MKTKPLVVYAAHLWRELSTSGCISVVDKDKLGHLNFWLSLEPMVELPK